MHTPIKTWLGVTIIIILALSAGMFIWFQQKNLAVDSPTAIIKPGAKQKACTEEAKLCPDGTAVGRTGPNCEFAECPGETNCAKEGESIGAVSPEAKIKQCCPGLEPVIPEKIVGTRGICRKINDQTSDWQTYRNEKYGFEVKYPFDFKIGHIDYTDLSDLKNLENYGIDDSFLVDINSSSEDDVLFNLGISSQNNFQELQYEYDIEINKTKYKTADEWFIHWRDTHPKSSGYEGISIKPKIINSDTIKVDEVPVIKSVFEGYPFLDTSVDFIKNDYHFRISFNGKNVRGENIVTGEILRKNKEIFDQILSTFKFID